MHGDQEREGRSRRRPGRRPAGRFGRTAVRLVVLVALAPWPAALAADVDGRPDALAVHKTVTARADLAGAIEEARLTTRLAARGDGAVTVVDPTSTEGLRDLDRWLAPRVRDGAAVWDLDLDGVTERRTVARYPAEDVPIAVAARYLLDGDPIAPEDLADATGEVTLRLLVRNLTSEARRIRYETPDGWRSESVDVAVPIVAQLDAGFGTGWADVSSDRGSVVATADGVRVVWTMALFEPLGELAQELEITGRIDGGAPPEVVLRGMPVTRRTSPELDASGRQLAAAQSEVAVLGFGLEESGAALREVADGVGELLDGLSQLSDGLSELADGLDDVADGAGQLAGGVEQTAEGAGELADGTGEVADGAGELAGALDGLADGAAGLADGTDELAGGLVELDEGAGELADGAEELAEGTAELAAALGIAAAGLEELLEGFDEIDLEPLIALLEGVRGAIDLALDALDGQPGVDDLVAALEALDAALEATVDVLGELDAPDEAALEGLTAIVEAAEALAAGADGLAEGAAGIDAGLGAAASGADELAAGAGDRAAGAGEVADGAGQLAGGLDELAAGTGELAAGLDALAVGAGELAAGLVEIAGGADELADGLGEAVGGVAELEDGIEQLADEAIDLLRRAADDTTGHLARDLARIEALEARAGDGVPFGAPDGATTSAAYEIRLAGAQPSQLPPVGQLAIGLTVLALAVGVGRAAGRRSAA